MLCVIGIGAWGVHHTFIPHVDGQQAERVSLEPSSLRNMWPPTCILHQMHALPEVATLRRSAHLVRPQAEQRELAATIRVSGSILLSTVSNFLDFFKLEAGKSLDIVRTLTDLRQLVADVHCIIEAMIGRQGEVALKEPSMAVRGPGGDQLGIMLSVGTGHHREQCTVLHGAEAMLAWA